MRALRLLALSSRGQQRAASDTEDVHTHREPQVPQGPFKKELLSFTAIKCLLSTRLGCAVQGRGSHCVAGDLLGSQRCVLSQVSTARPSLGAWGNSGV